jgi:hypothetical protein
MLASVSYSQGITSAFANLPLVFVAIVIVVTASAIAAAAKKLVESSLGGLSYATVLANTASAAIVTFGVIAALDQLKIATDVVNAILYAALVAIVGVVIVAVGGGGIKTMSQRWELVAARYDEEKPKMQQQVRSAPSVTEQARQAQGSLQTSGDDRRPQTRRI